MPNENIKIIDSFKLDHNIWYGPQDRVFVMDIPWAVSDVIIE